MSVSANLSFRIAAVLIGGFVLLQLVVGTVMLLPSEVYERRGGQVADQNTDIGAVRIA